MVNNIIKGVSLICTVYNESKSIEEFLSSIFSMTHFPEEFIIVDGGSKDGTVELITSYLETNDFKHQVQLIVDPTCNLKFTPSPVARGRNVAIQHTHNSIIACTDAGCLIGKDWIKSITQPLINDQSIDVVNGRYYPDARSFLEQSIGLLWNIKRQTNTLSFVPSSRSVAFRKSAWERVGGYPETSYTGEDTGFVLALQKAGCRFATACDAVVFWRMKSTINNFVKLFYRYGFGDGFNWQLPINVLKNLVKISIFIFLFVFGLLINQLFIILLILYWLYLPFVGRLNELFKLNVLIKSPLIAFLKNLADISYLIGYALGRISAINK